MSRLFILLGFLSFVPSVDAAELARFEYEEAHMGTKFRIVLYAKDQPTAATAAKAAFGRVAELNRIMSDYDSGSRFISHLGDDFLPCCGCPRPDILEILAFRHLNSFGLALPAF